MEEEGTWVLAEEIRRKLVIDIGLLGKDGKSVWTKDIHGVEELLHVEEGN
jgi:hypothetical protein